MGVSGRVQELRLDPIIFNFLNNDLKVDGSDLMTFTSGITLQSFAQK